MMPHLPLALSGLESLEWAGMFAACGAAAVAILAADRRRSAAAAIAALLLAPAVVAGQVWEQDQLTELRSDPLELALLLVAAGGLVAATGALFVRRPVLLPLALIATLPFRVPVEAGGQAVNILLPLYLAIGGAVAAFAWTALRAPRPEPPPPGSEPAPPPGAPASPARESRPAMGLRRALAIVVVLYGIQAAWSIDLDNAAKQVAFFLVPFAVLFRLLLDVRWDRRLLRWAFGILVAEALVFALVGFWEYQARELLWNPKVVNSNQFETFFRVNSVFWDPNIYGRFLAVVMVGIAAVMLWSGESRRVWQTALALAVLWGGLLLTFSQSSFAALLAGLAVLAAIRWSFRWTAIAVAALAAGAIVFVVAFGDTVRLNVGSTKSLDRATSGRVELIEGGLELAAEDPVGGQGSGSFARAYLRERGGGTREAVSASHTEPVTVAAEQGAVGLIAYAVLLLVAVRTLLAGPLSGLGRAALVAALGALLFHTLAYAAFLTDPVTWAILAVGAALAVRRTVPEG